MNRTNKILSNKTRNWTFHKTSISSWVEFFSIVWWFLSCSRTVARESYEMWDWLGRHDWTGLELFTLRGACEKAMQLCFTDSRHNFILLKDIKVPLQRKAFAFFQSFSYICRLPNDTFTNINHSPRFHSRKSSVESSWHRVVTGQHKLSFATSGSIIY